MAAEAQVALIHGGGIQVVGEGYELRPGSVRRAEAGIALYHKGVVEALLFSGGNGHGHGLAQSEAGLMADMALHHGVPAGCIEREGASSSTVGNWANSLAMLQGAGIETVLGVTGRVAASRAAWVGQEIIDHYRMPVDIVGYHTSAEAEGLRAYPREAVSMLMAKRCLQAAERNDVAIDELDGFYLAWKNRTGLAHAKAHLTHR